MNLIITDYCNRNCPYCFAKDKVGLAGDTVKKDRTHISLENVDWYLDYLVQNNVKLFKILGGEPTLHPELPEIIDKGLEKEMEIVLFTNGLWPQHILEYFKKFEEEKVKFVFNVNEPSLQTDHENQTQKKALQIAGNRAMLGFNIYRTDFNLLFCADLINQFSLQREIRLGLASPIVRENNKFLKQQSIKIAGKRLARQLRELEASDILGSIDCGFPLCMFDEEDLGSIVKTTSKGFISICDNPIDVDANLNVWPCFPLSKILNVHLTDFKNMEELKQFYFKKLSPFRNLGSMDECFTCKFLRRGQCTGGCLGRTIRSLEESGDKHLVEKLKA